MNNYQHAVNVHKINTIKNFPNQENTRTLTKLTKNETTFDVNLNTPNLHKTQNKCNQLNKINNEPLRTNFKTKTRKINRPCEQITKSTTISKHTLNINKHLNKIKKTTQHVKPTSNINKQNTQHLTTKKTIEAQSLSTKPMTIERNLAKSKTLNKVKVLN